MILPAGINEVERARLQHSVAGFINAVMDNGTVGPGAGNRVEGRPAEERVRCAKFAQPGGGGKLVHRGVLPQRAIQPRKKAGQCGAIAHVRLAGAVQLNGVLDGFWSGAGVGPFYDAPTGGGERGGEPVRCGVFVHQQGLASAAHGGKCVRHGIR